MSQGSSSQSQTVYIQLNQITEICRRDVFLKDIGEVTCRDKVILSKCRALKVKSIPEKEARRYVMSALEVVQKLESIDPSIEVNNLGESDFIIAYTPPKAPEMCWQWLKTLFVCLVSFFGAAFAIMTFNNDVNVGDVLGQVYFQVMGRQSDGFGLMEAGYSVGLAVGILVFFNHFAVRKLNTDPTPLEVEMRLYEENICKTLIDQADRKEKEIDVD